MQEKLKEIGFSSSVSSEFLADIFGKHLGCTFQAGLVDCSTVEEFDERLKLLKPIWNARESSSEPAFHRYFVQYQADVVRHHMSRDLRESCGLGSPSTEFTTNCSESINAALKCKVNYKESDWPQFNQHIRGFVESQREEITHALSGHGRYCLNPDFSHYGVTTSDWKRMRSDQRQQVLRNFEKASFPVRAMPSSSTSKPSEPEGMIPTASRYL